MVGPFSTKRALPNLLQNTWVAGRLKIDCLQFHLPCYLDVWVSFHLHHLQFIIHDSFLSLTPLLKDVLVPGVAGPTLAPTCPEYWLVIPMTIMTTTMSVSTTTTARSTPFRNRLGTHPFGLCSLCFIVWKRTFITGMVRWVAIVADCNKIISPVTLGNIPFICLIQGL